MNIYFDNAASSITDKRVIDYLEPYLERNSGNASSIHHFGKKLKVMLEDTRETVASYLNAKPKEIFFTSGGTESNNFFIKGLVFANLTSYKNKIITSNIEHPAVLETINYLKKFGVQSVLIKADKTGTINADEVIEKIDDNTLLVTIMHANNELGTINDIGKIGKFCRSKNIVFHSDTVQSTGKTYLNLVEMYLDGASFSAHKFYGGKGIGMLYVRDGTKIDKYFHGGSQERNMRGGTENIPAIAGLKKAIEILIKEQQKDLQHYKDLKEYLLNKLNQEFNNDYKVNSYGYTLDNIINITFDHKKLNVPSGMLPVMLDLKGIAVSGGSACSSGSLKPSKVLLEIGKTEEEALSSIRISFGRTNIKEEIDKFVKALVEILR